MAGIATNPYATGRRRYNGPGRNPNQGPTANLSGYRQRDLQQQVKSDAQKRAYGDMYRRFTRR